MTIGSLPINSPGLARSAALDLDEFLERLRLTLADSLPAWSVPVIAAAVLAVAWQLFAVTRKRSHQVGAAGEPRASSARAEPARTVGSVGPIGARVLIVIAVVAAVAVAGLGGVRSFAAVSDRFGSALVPLTADGMIIASTALRLAALTRGWRLPGSLVTTYGFISGTVWLNVAAAAGWTDAVAHALAPVSYAVLVEMLAHLLRLHLRLAQPSRPRVTALTWVTSPVVTTRVWLHMARTGEPDPAVARALVQQLLRMSSRLQAVCPSRPLRGGWPLDRAHAARTAALQTIRDGVLSAAELAALLPADGHRLNPGALLALVDRAALAVGNTRPTAPYGAPSSATGGAGLGALTSAAAGAVNGALHGPVTGAVIGAPRSSAGFAPTDVDADRSGDSGELHSVRVGVRSDDELVAELRRYADRHHSGQPLTQRHVMRVLGVGTPKAKRLAELAWPTTPGAGNHGHGRDEPRQRGERGAPDGVGGGERSRGHLEARSSQ